MQKLELRQLIERAKRRDPEAFTQLIQMHTNDMYRVAIAILRHDENAADAIQETILACWEKLSTLNSPEYFRTWLIRILIRKCYDIRTHYARQTGLDELEEPSREDTYNLEFKEAVSSLGEPDSTILTLYYGLGYTAREIAGLLGLSPGNIRVRLSRARKNLKEYYDENR